MNLKLLKDRNFALLILGKLVSLLGSNMQQFALSLYVLELTGSTTIFASILAISILPRLLLSPIAGVFGDWFDRKKSIVILDLINANIIAIFALIYVVNGSLSLPMIYILVILLEITEIFFQSAMSAVLPSMVKRENLLEANSFSSLVMNIGNILAPIIAASLYSGLGMKVILIVNSFSFFLSAISECFISIPKHHKSPDKINIKAFKNDLIEGIKIIRSNKLISTMIGLGTFINFSISPLYSIGLVYIVREVLKASELQFGIYQMSLYSSMLLAPILCGGIMKKVKVGRLSFLAFGTISILVFIMALIPTNSFINAFDSNIVPLIGIMFISFLIGIASSLVNINIRTLFNQLVPLELMGRTSTVFNLAVTVFIPVGQMIFGLLYDIIIPSLAVTLSGLMCMIITIRYKKDLLSYDELEEEKSNYLGEIINEI